MNGFTSYIILLLCVICFISVVQCNQPPTITYSPEIALEYLLFSYTAMCSPDVIQSWSCNRCTELFPTAHSPSVFYHNSTDITGYSIIYNNTIIVSFKGTTDFINVIVDAEFLRKDYPECENCKVHSGFYDSWLEIRDQVQAGVTNQLKICPDCNIMVTGHSLGAAISAFCTLELLDWFPNIDLKTYTFGQPRAGNDYFSDYYNSKQRNTFRVVNQADLVPHLPPQQTINEYKHVPNEIWYFNSTDYKVCDDSGEDPTCSDSVDPLDYSIKYHLSYFEQNCNCV